MIVVADAVGNLHLRYPGELTVCLVRHSEHPGATFHSQPPRWGGGVPAGSLCAGRATQPAADERVTCEANGMTG